MGCVVNEAFPRAHVQELKAALEQLVTLLPEHVLVGVITFGSMVQGRPGLLPRGYCCQMVDSAAPLLHAFGASVTQGRSYLQLWPESGLPTK